MSAKLILAPHKNTCELFQSLDIKFAFVNKFRNKYTQSHVAIKCRDFLGDCIWSTQLKRPASIYGFVFNAVDTPLDKKKTRLSLKFPDTTSMENFKNNFSFLIEKENIAGVTNSTIISTDKENTLIIESDKVWQQSIWKLSLFTFYIKLMGYKTNKEAQDPEDKFIKLLTESIEKKFLLAVKNKKIKETLSKHINISHNYSGFVSIIQNSTDHTHKINKQILGGE